MKSPLAAPRRITVRGVLIGLAGAMLIAVLAPYNDYVVNNSFLIGSYFPPVVAMGLGAIVLLVNAPLYRFAPKRVLTPGELAIILAIWLAACGIPSQGLLRQLVPMPVAPFSVTGSNPQYHDLLQNMHLPSWLFAVESTDTGHRERIVTAFYNRLQPGEPLPWSAWVRPMLGWGVFAGAFLTALLALACLLRFQWAVNERLPFPITQLELMLIEPPPPGRILNGVFRAKGFWVAMAAVFVIESSVVLHRYFPQQVPSIPFGFDFRAIMGDEPWVRLPDWFKTSNIFFTLVGLTYFTQTRVSFSLWGTAVLLMLGRWLLDPSGTYLPGAAFNDQQLGGAFAFIGGVLWIGRRQWAAIAGAFVGGAQHGRGAPARGEKAAALFLTAAVIVMVGWLIVVGCSIGLTLAIVAMILAAHVITARVVAETGLAFIRVPFGVDQVLTALPASLLTPRDAFLYGTAHYGFMQAGRESELTFAMHALNVVDKAEESPAPRGLTGMLGAAVAVAAIACVVMSIWCYYHYAVSLDQTDTTGVLNVWGTRYWIHNFLVDFPTQVQRGVWNAKPYNPWVQIAIGIGVMTVLQTLTWRFTAWPFLPVGFLLATSGYINIAWFSLFLGWIAKLIILRLGGAKLFSDLKPVFIGLIFGEALATAVWLIVTLVLAFTGQAFHVVRFLPQ